jgi:8-oxo-dGTP diphosphatase
MKTLRTVGCFIQYEGKFIILYRHPNKPQGDTWGLPAGKVDPGESDKEAMLREVKEETGYAASPTDLEFLGEQVFHFSDLELVFPTFRIRLREPWQVTYSPLEHQAYRWVSAEECYAMPNLIEGFHELLERVGYIKAPVQRDRS